MSSLGANIISLGNSILKSDEKPLLLVFTAEWMSNSVITEVVIEKLKHHYQESLNIYLVDVDEHPDLASKFRITKIPTYFIFKDKEILAKGESIFSKMDIIKLISTPQS